MIEAHVPFYLIAAGLLVAGNAFFVAAEFAIVKVRTTRIEEMATSGLPGSTLAREVVAHLDEYLGVCQLGITLVSLGLGWIGERAFAGLLLPLLQGLGPLAAPAAHSLAITGAFLIITILHIVLGELVPKSIAIRKPGQIARLSALPLNLFRKVFYPALWALNGSANTIVNMFGMRQSQEPAISENELRLLFEESIRKGVITASEAEIMDRATRFADRTAADVMVPIERVVSWALDRSTADNLALAREHRHTRYPVHDAAKDDFVGVINIKALALEGDMETRTIDVGAVKKDLLRVPEARRIDVVLKQMRRRHVHMAAVVNRWGRPAGILTMEDIIEEIFGEIEDEFDDEPPPEQGRAR
jgi:CBS domain containing-hemolysin-like protein